MSGTLPVERLEKTEENPVITISSAILELVSKPEVDLDKVEKFLSIHQQLEDREAEKAFYQALSGFQSEAPVIKKSKVVDFTATSGKQTRYSYAPIEEMVEPIKPLLKKFGLSFVFNLKYPKGEEAQIICTVSHRLGHHKDFHYWFNPQHDDNRMNASQKRKSAVTYAKRLVLENALGLVTEDEDDDAGTATDKTIPSRNLLTEKQKTFIQDLLKSTNTETKDLFEHMQIDPNTSINELSAEEASKAIGLLKAKGNRRSA